MGSRSWAELVLGVQLAPGISSDPGPHLYFSYTLAHDPWLPPYGTYQSLATKKSSIKRGGRRVRQGEGSGPITNACESACADAHNA